MYSANVRIYHPYLSAVDVSMGWIYGSLEELLWPNSILAHQLTPTLLKSRVVKPKAMVRPVCSAVMELTFTYCSQTFPKHHKPPLAPVFLPLFTTHLFSFSAFCEEGRSPEGEKLLGDLSPTVSYKDHQVKVDDSRQNNIHIFSFMLFSLFQRNLDLHPNYSGR